MMLTGRLLRRFRALAGAAAGGLLLQAGCAIDPDLILQAVIQLLTEFAIFATDTALVGLR
jgi:hypothetical protein